MYLIGVKSLALWMILEIVTADTCDWNSFNRSQAQLTVHRCKSPIIDPVFLSTDNEATKNAHELRKLKIETDLTLIKNNTFTMATNLQLLDLGYNKISIIAEKAFTGLKQLETLNLESNEIQNIQPNIFNDLKSLEYLNFIGNKLTSFNFAYVEMNFKLQKLLLSQNQISQIKTSELFSVPSISNLKLLSLSKNQLTQDSFGDLPHLSKLEKLYLYTNKFIQLDFDDIQHKFPKLAEISITNNPFDCCYLMEMIKSLKAQMPNIKVDELVVPHLNDSKAFLATYKCIPCTMVLENRDQIKNQTLNLQLQQKLQQQLQRQLQGIDGQKTKNTVLISVLYVVVILLGIGVLVSHWLNRKNAQDKCESVPNIEII